MSQPRVYLFGTCLVDTFYPQTGMAALALLELCGYQVIFPQNQSCCGQPPFNSGFPDQTRQVAIQTIGIFSDEEIPVVIPSASCAGMIKNHYPSLFESEPKAYQQAMKLSERTYELIDFISDRLPYDKLHKQNPEKICLHTSCSAKRELQVAERWLDTLNKLPGVSTYIPKYDHECCGFGGTFAVKSSEISSAMTKDKATAINATNAEQFVTGDCGCMMNIQGHLDNENLEMTSQSLASFILSRFQNHDAAEEANAK